MKLKPIVEDLYPLNRSLNTDDTERALQYLSKLMPDSELEAYQVGGKAWTWTIPERWRVREAYLMCNGEKILDFDDNPLCLVSYSLPMSGRFTYDELLPHLYYNANNPTAIPWIYKYYDRDWGFCLPKYQLDTLPKDGNYYVRIFTDFTKGPFLTLTQKIGDNPKELMCLAHICHAAQANDDLSGVATLLEVSERLRNNPLPAGSLSVRFLFSAETIGSIVYLSHHTNDIQAGIFAEMTGTSGELAFHLSSDKDINSVAYEYIDQCRLFGDEPANDERVLQSVGIPCISINRWPYPEYHTNHDNPSIISEDKLQEAADVIERIIRIYASNYIPRPTWTGYPFLSGMGLFSPLAQKTILHLDGLDVLEISQRIGEDYFTVFNELQKFVDSGNILKE